MDELFRTVDNLSGASTTERVTPSDRSNKDKKKNGFLNVLKEKMHEKHKDEDLDQLVLHDDEEEIKKETEEENKHDDEQPKSQETAISETDNSDDDTSVAHIDFKA